ncbi:chromate transporter [Novispirillum itersonii]|uniref:Chromate transporter n=1 Tax=Novispirillum itersonii TaxID=189 RepID=A0A7X0DKW8_NOVIT|nr:chromate transporter [Novispirillum itersonii]MBB6209403.1 chromate transporter [Novispirillum itersonii]
MPPDDRETGISPADSGLSDPVIPAEADGAPSAVLPAVADTLPEWDPPPPAAVTPWGLFLLFSSLAMIGFGGVLPWVHRSLVERRRILTQAEFAEIFAFSQLLPGPTICNLAIIVGYRRCGALGGLAAVTGMVVPPAIGVLGLAVLYDRYGGTAVVSDVLRGMSVVAVALICSMAVKMARGMPRTLRAGAFAGAMFAAIALLKWPLVAVMFGLGGLAVLIQKKPGGGEA